MNSIYSNMSYYKFRLKVLYSTGFDKNIKFIDSGEYYNIDYALHYGKKYCLNQVIKSHPVKILKQYLIQLDYRGIIKVTQIQQERNCPNECYIS